MHYSISHSSTCHAFQVIMGAPAQIAIGDPLMFILGRFVKVLHVVVMSKAPYAKQNCLRKCLIKTWCTQSEMSQQSVPSHSPPFKAEQRLQGFND